MAPAKKERGEEEEAEEKEEGREGFVLQRQLCCRHFFCFLSPFLEEARQELAAILENPR